MTHVPQGTARHKRKVRRRSIIEAEHVPIAPMSGALRKLSKQGWWQVREALKHAQPSLLRPALRF
jgi:hypothetical protein